MGCGKSAAADDEKDLDSFLKEAKIKRNGLSPYSPSLDYLKEGFKKGFKGPRLELYLKHTLEKKELEFKQNEELQEYYKYLDLKTKYE